MQSLVRTFGRLGLAKSSRDESEYLRHVSALYSPGYGTEHMSKIIHAVVRFIRPMVVLEIGVGYTTPFILRALGENEADVQRERELFSLMQRHGEAQGIMMEHPAIDDRLPFYSMPYTPRLFAIDDYSLETLDFAQAMDAIRALGLESRLKLVKSSFVGAAPKLGLARGELDMIWFDAKSSHGTLADFLIEYWPLLRSDGGVLLVHFTAGYDKEGKAWWIIDIRDLIIRLGLETNAEGLEQLQLVEPQKYRQGAVTMIRRIGNSQVKYHRMVSHPAVVPQVYKGGVKPPALPAGRAPREL